MERACIKQTPDTRLAPLVAILREKFSNRNLDPDNVLMPAPIPPPSTPAPDFRKKEPEVTFEARRLEAEAEVVRAQRTLNSFGRGDRRDRGRGGGARSASNDRGRGRDRGRQDPIVCHTCNGVGHHRNVCPNNAQASEGQDSHAQLRELKELRAKKEDVALELKELRAEKKRAETPHRKAANLRVLSYQLPEDDDGSFYQ